MTDNSFSCMDSCTPGGVYLCQVKPGVSCGACCGLYNVVDASRPAIYSLLSNRTRLFSEVGRNYESVLAFADEIAEIEDQNRPFENFYHCPFIGFMDTEPESPGCLLHPLASKNNGLDLRGASYYGGMTCSMYFCPACREVPERYKKILRSVSDDWYLFGLVITESEAVKCFFENIEKDSGIQLDPDSAVSRPDFCEAVRFFMNLKTVWPFRKDGILADYFFNDREIWPDEKIYNNANRWTPVLKAFRSEISCSEDMEKASDILDEAVSRAVQAF